MDNIISKFTNHLKSVLTRALTLVIEQKGDVIEPEHLLWALGTQPGSVAAEVLQKAGVDQRDLESFIEQDTDQQLTLTSTQSVPSLSDTSKTLIEKAVLIASQYEHRYVGTEHLLSSLTSAPTDDIRDFLEDVDVAISLIEKNLQTIFSTTKQVPEILDNAEKAEPSSIESLLSPAKPSQVDEEDESKTPALDYFTEELTEKTFATSVDPVIGRESEIDRLMKIVARRTKNNPILVGEPGVGKTAIVEGFAKRIVEGNVPDALKDKRVFRLDLASLIAGTMYRGEFESRLKQLIEEVEDLPEVILFIDEVHSVMGAGAASGSLDAANMLKPALARGAIRCIGATTPAEFKKFIETDGALERRFQPIRVNEPTLEKTREILHGVKTFYEEFHGVSYTDEAIESALTLAQRFLTDKQFPDKAIDLLDEAGAAARVKRPVQVSAADQRDALIEELEELESMKKAAVESELFEKAIEVKEAEQRLRKKIADTQDSAIPVSTINDEDIFQVVAEITGMPVKELNKKEKTHLGRLAKRLKQYVVGQDETVEQVARAIARAKLGLAPTQKPLTSFLFVGPSGVGKTALAKAIAKEVFVSEKALLRLDMSEFSSSFTVSKLIGSPAGYVGYRDSALLTDHVKQNPHSVVLFDELEKAHPEVVHILLQILEEGELTDATGRTVNFRNCIIVLTSNIGSELFEREAVGFAGDTTMQQSERDKQIREKARDHFSRELVNRLQRVFIFQPLGDKVRERIALSQLSDLQERLALAGVTLKFDKKAAKVVAKHSEEKYGGRDVIRVIEQHVEHPLTEALIAAKYKDGKTFQLNVAKDGTLRILHKKT